MNRRNQFDAGAADARRRAAGRTTEAFQRGWAAAEAAADQVMAGAIDLRVAGGWSAVLTAAFVAAAGDATVPGLFNQPMPVRALLTPVDLANLRLEAQRRAARS